MMEKPVSEIDDIRAHLDNMALSHEHLSGMGITIHNKDYVSMVLMSLPDSYTTYLETLADAAISSRRTFTAPEFIARAIELADKHQLRASHDPKSGQKDSTLHHQMLATNLRKATCPRRTLSALTAVKRATFPATVTGPCYGSTAGVDTSSDMMT